MPRDLRTEAIVLRRTNYGEADRIIVFITPVGKISALARSVRKEKSRLAGSIELFSVSDINIHQGHSRLAILTGAKMLRHYHKIVGDLANIELASVMMKKVEKTSEHADIPELFDLLDQALAGLDSGSSPALISAWFHLNLMRAVGEEINLHRDVYGKILQPDQKYNWDAIEMALRPVGNGSIGPREIKLARLMLVSPLRTILKIDNIAENIAQIMPLIKF